MIYVAVFLVLLLAILIVFVVRLWRNRMQQHQAKHDPSVLPSHVQDISSDRPTLIGTARDVTARWTVPRNQDPHQAAGVGAGYRRDVGGVTRIQSRGSVTSLPAYGAESLPVPPEAVYNPGRPNTTVPLYVDAPPKYTASTQSGVVV